VQYFDWRDGDVVFANSTCYDETRLEQIAQLARKLSFTIFLSLTRLMDVMMLVSGGMKKGSFFISMTRRLPISDFEVVESNTYPMSWGDASIFIMQKVTEADNNVTLPLS
jgi:hypothetical protein